MKKKRGEYGYIKAKKKRSLIGTGIMALCGIIIFLIGFFLNHRSNQNIFTVIAVLFALPAAKFLVAFIVLFPHHTPPKERYEKAQKALSDGMTLYSDLVITSSEKVMHLDFAAIGSRQVIGVIADEKQDINYIRKYLRNGVQNWGEDYKVKILDSEKKFLAEISNVTKEETDPEEEKKVKSYLVSLIV